MVRARAADQAGSFGDSEESRRAGAGGWRERTSAALCSILDGEKRSRGPLTHAQGFCHRHYSSNGLNSLMPDKRQVFAEFAHIGQVLSSGARLELMALLFQAERTVEELSDLSALSVANVSQHLQVLRQARMVQVRRAGLFAYYRACDNGIFALWNALRTFGEANVADVQRILRQFLKPRDGTEAVTADELQRRIDDRSAIVIDVRPAEEFADGHIAGAVSMPLKELEMRLKELPKRTPIVAYCRGPYCVQSDAAVALLAKRGFKAKRLEIGLPDWRARGLPVEAILAAPRTKRARTKVRKRRVRS